MTKNNSTRWAANLFCMALLALFTAPLALAQDASFRAHLSKMPTTPQTKNAISGGGEVIATLEGHTLTISGHFEGMSSVATMAHVHMGPPAQPGPVVSAITAPDATGGELSGQIELNDEQLAALKVNSLYVQIHSADNAAGELRGWFFAR